MSRSECNRNPAVTGLILLEAQLRVPAAGAERGGDVVQGAGLQPEAGRPDSRDPRLNGTAQPGRKGGRARQPEAAWAHRPHLAEPRDQPARFTAWRYNFIDPRLLC